jgi:hypothetical protein
MAVGFPVTKNDIDLTLGQIVVQLRDSIFRVPGVKARIDAISDTELVALGYSDADVTLMRNTLADLNQIYLVTTGQAAQPTPYDFRTNVAQVTGIA